MSTPKKSVQKPAEKQQLEFKLSTAGPLLESWLDGLTKSKHTKAAKHLGLALAWIADRHGNPIVTNIGGQCSPLWFAMMQFADLKDPKHFWPLLNDLAAAGWVVPEWKPLANNQKYLVSITLTDPISKGAVS